MKNCLIGHTGFVGSNIAEQMYFDDFYNSQSIEKIESKNYNLVVCAGTPGAKWIANQNPKEDWRKIEKLLYFLSRVRVERFVLISTVDVYKIPSKVDEKTDIDIFDLHPYGKHRRMVEQFVQTNFPKHHVIRLPGLFGKGLKKNAIYDILNNNQVDKIHKDSRYQFYYLARICKDIKKVIKNKIPLVNFATEPLSIEEIAKRAFGKKFVNISENPPADYDVKTVLALYKSKKGYIMDKNKVIKDLRKFIDEQKASIKY